LSDQDGKDVSLSDLVGRSKAVALIFYRGFW
jgi:peroxiredoxin